MKSLITISESVKAAVLASLLILCLAAVGIAQRTDAQSQGQRYGDPGFRGEPINLNVVNADIRDILSYITDQYGINFVIDKSVKDTPVTVKVNDVPWNVALDSVLQSQELGVQVNGNILRIADAKTLAAEQEVQAKIREGMLDTTNLYTEIVRLNYATVAGGASVAGTTSGTAVSSGSGSGGGPSASGGSGGEGLLPIIKRRLSRRGSIETDPRSNSLIITDVAANIQAVKQLIAILDQPEPQVEIEARIVVASRNFSRDIGVQISGLVLGSRDSGAVGGTLPNLKTGLNGGATIPNPSINGNLVSQLASSAIGLTTGIFGTAQISAMITAGEQKGQAKVIATPRVTALNNRSAVIKSGTKIPVTTVQPGSAGANGAVIATTTYVDVPLSLAITPQITDLGTVILTVTAENASTATIVGGVAPQINSQSMQTVVTVPDGGTTVVGGVLFDDERDTQDRVPGLANIPVLGKLFQRKATQRNTNEILFFITPRISRPDLATATPNNGVPRPTILQPVPMGNPPSNSQPVVVDPTVPAGSGAVKPEASGTPKKN